MADECHMRLLGLMILCSFFTGISGINKTRMFCSSGENVRLPCNNALSDCTSTTWIYSRQSPAVELIAEGEKKDIERHERLNLGSNCSLNIMKVTKEDYGSYSCRQYVNGKQNGSDAGVYLLFLQVSSSSSQSEISPGSSVTLFCQLYYYKDSCDALVRAEGVELIWVNQTGVNLQTDSRYQISFSSEHCNSSLTTTLLNEDHNREWRCQVTQRNELKTSAAYTVKYTDTSTTDQAEFYHKVIMISAGAAASAAALVVVLWVICKHRAGNKRGTDSSVKVKDRNEHKGTYETIDMSIPIMPDTSEQRDEVTYSEVTASSKNQVQMDYNDSNHTVIYAAIRGTENEPQGGLSTSVNTTTPHK